MKRNFYIFSSGILRRKNNTIWLITKEGDKRAIPLEVVDSLFCFSDVTLNSRFLDLLCRKEITMAFFGRRGNFIGLFLPRETNVSGHVVVKQVEHHLDTVRRIKLAKLFVQGALANMSRNLTYYANRGRDLSETLALLKAVEMELAQQDRIDSVLGCEGKAWQIYYNSWNQILSTKGFEFTQRSRRPPENPINALISFGNSLLYSVTLAELRRTPLHPAVSFLHSAGTHRFSLSLDIAEVFKPVIVDRLIFNLVNHEIVTENDFEKGLNYCYLKESGRKRFIEKFDEKLRTTLRHNKLKRHVSYRQLIRLECYKLVKHILDDEEYKPFISQW